MHSESNFYYAASGVVVAGLYTFVLTDRYKEWVKLSLDPEGGTLFMLLMVGSAIFAAAFTLSMLIVVKVSGPLMVSITGTARDVLLTYAGYFFFPGSILTLYSAIGMAFGFSGAIHHMHYKFSNAPKKTTTPAESSSKKEQ